jgi:heme/copper-type cytochrome/quinol oxidase subunit 1
MGFILSMILLGVGTTMGFISDIVSVNKKRNLNAKTEN